MKRGFTIGLIITSFFAYGQNEEIDLEQFAERLFEIQDESIEYEDLYESLFLYYTNKLNLNKVSKAELESLYILTIDQITSFINYRIQFGDLLDIHELQAIPDFDLQTIKLLRPFVSIKESTLDTRPFLRRLIEEENNYLLLRYSRRLENQIGYSPPFPLDTTFIRNSDGVLLDTLTSEPERYQGSPDKIYGRFRTSHRNDFSLGFTFEKDAGEAIKFNRKQYGFDFYSFHLLLENKLGFNRIMLGDFQLQVGQSIVFGAGFNAGKGAETVNTVRRSTIGLRPYTSVLESQFFRGIGLSKQFGDLEITALYSGVKRDANVQVDSTAFSLIFGEETVNGTLPINDPERVFEEEFANSIITSGLHRTRSELERKNQIKEQAYGGVVTYSPNRNFKIGGIGIHTRYDIPIGRTPNNYNQFEFRGDRNSVFSIFSDYSWENFVFFGEAARSTSGGIGAIGGFMASLSSRVDLAMMHRDYDRDFHSFYGNAFSESSRNINEKGTYWGISIKPNRRHRINMYYDLFQFPWLRFRTEAPSTGNEWLVRYTHFRDKNLTIFTQVRQQTRQLTIPNENLNKLIDQVRYNFLFHVDYSLNDRLQLKTRVQGSTQKENNIRTKGFAIIQDVNFSIWKLDFHTRTALFETEDFDNAQYAYENDVLYAFSIPAYNGSGIRNYLMVRYDPFQKLSIWVRYASFTFRNQRMVGSGLDASEGPRSSEIKLMLRVKF